MRPKYLTLSALLLSSAGFVLSAGSAHAIAADFCKSEDGCTDFETIYVENISTATVTSVNITQEKGDASCQKVKKKVSRDVSGWTPEASGEYFRFKANSLCKYKVKFKTTKGCTGDKTAHITPSGIANGKYVVKLKNTCGTLKTKVLGRREVVW